MKKKEIYTAKFIPIDGEIKDGDHYWNHKMNIYAIRTSGNSDSAYEGFQKVKLHICTNNFVVGDVSILGVVTIIDGDDITVSDKKDNMSLLVTRRECLVPIGELLFCDWVMDGDEFFKEDLFANGVGYNWSSYFKGYKFKTKCPMCNHYPMGV
jgi:hypothetical protein